MNPAKFTVSSKYEDGSIPPINEGFTPSVLPGGIVILLGNTLGYIISLVSVSTRYSSLYLVVLGRDTPPHVLMY